MKELTQVYCRDLKTSLKQVSTRACASQDCSPIPTQYGTDQLCGGIFQKHATRDPVDIFPAPWPPLFLSLCFLLAQALCHENNSQPGGVLRERSALWPRSSSAPLVQN